jgi:hypothetical protein
MYNVQDGRNNCGREENLQNMAFKNELMSYD